MSLLAEADEEGDVWASGASSYCLTSGMAERAGNQHRGIRVEKTWRPTVRCGAGALR